MCVLTIGKKNWCAPPCHNVSGRGAERGEPVGGLGSCEVGW